jgi:hypothetical protein
MARIGADCRVMSWPDITLQSAPMRNNCMNERRQTRWHQYFQQCANLKQRGLRRYCIRLLPIKLPNLGMNKYQLQAAAMPVDGCQCGPGVVTVPGPRLPVHGVSMVCHPALLLLTPADILAGSLQRLVSRLFLWLPIQTVSIHGQL